MSNFDESDQAGLVGDLLSIHLNREDHNGKPNPDCTFCQGFIIPTTSIEEHKPTYEFIIFDVSDGSIEKLPVGKQPTFKEELESLINRYSKENDSDTSDFILARYLLDCLKAFNKATRNREEWYGKREQKKFESLPVFNSYKKHEVYITENITEDVLFPGIDGSSFKIKLNESIKPYTLLLSEHKNVPALYLDEMTGMDTEGFIHKVRIGTPDSKTYMDKKYLLAGTRYYYFE